MRDSGEGSTFLVGMLTRIAWSTGRGSSSRASIAATRFALFMARLMRFLALLAGSLCVSVSLIVCPTFSPVKRKVNGQISDFCASRWSRVIAETR